MASYSHNVRRRMLAGDMPSWIVGHPRAAYIIRLILATPPWVDLRAINRIKNEARYRSRLGVPYVADHIVPLTHKLVCGLNVPWNLRIITRAENARRSNAWWEYSADLFENPEQLRLL
jgi:hypothetical protein